MFETFEHTADLGLRVRADSIDQLFVDAARGLSSMIVLNLDSVQMVEERTIELEGDESDLLLFDWLNELLFSCESEGLVFAEFDVTIKNGKMTGVARGETIDPKRHELDHEVKAITYHGLKVVLADSGWLAEVIVDI